MPQFIPKNNIELNDSNAYDSRYTKTTHTNKDTVRIIDGYVYSIQPEPLYKQNLVTVKLSRGGTIGNVPYPSPNVCLGMSGLPSPSVKMVHGLYESLLQGQHVVVGFVEGNASKPVILNKYQYEAIDIPVLSPTFYMPLTRLGIFPSDIALGHHTGSSIILRGALPIPGHIEINSITSLEIKSNIGTTISSKKSVTITDGLAGINHVTVDTVLSKVEIGGMFINIKPVIGGMLRLGKAPVAFCNNFPVCLFTGAPHSTSTDVMV